MAVGVLGGAVFGLMLYGINFYTATVMFPWFFAARSWTLAAARRYLRSVDGGQ